VYRGHSHGRGVWERGGVRHKKKRKSQIPEVEGGGNKGQKGRARSCSTRARMDGSPTSDRKGEDILKEMSRGEWRKKRGPSEGGRNRTFEGKRKKGFGLP